MVYIGDLNYEEIKRRITHCRDQRHRLLFAILFLTGARIGEIVRYHRDHFDMAEKARVNPPLKDSDIFIESLPSGKKMIVFKVKKEKIKTGRPFKLIYVNPKKEWELVKIVLEAKKQKKLEGGG